MKKKKEMKIEKKLQRRMILTQPDWTNHNSEIMERDIFIVWTSGEGKPLIK